MKKQAKKLKLKKETLSPLTSVVGAYPSDLWECAGSLLCPPPPPCPSAPYQSCVTFPASGADPMCDNEFCRKE